MLDESKESPKVSRTELRVEIGSYKFRLSLNEEEPKTPQVVISSPRLNYPSLDSTAKGSATSPETPAVNSLFIEPPRQSSYSKVQSQITAKPGEVPKLPKEEKPKFTLPTVGIVSVSPKKNSTNKLLDRFGISSDPETYKDDNYKLQGMPDGLYAWIKTKTATTVKGQFFPAGTIFCRLKNGIEGGSDHKGLAENVGLGEKDDIIKSEHIDAGGVLVIKDDQIKEWNCRTGRFWQLCKLNRDNIKFEVGLPEACYRTIGHRGDSPSAARGMIARNFDSIEDFEKASSKILEQASKGLEKTPSRKRKIMPKPSPSEFFTSTGQRKTSSLKPDPSTLPSSKSFGELTPKIT